jgi:hypothetical protein
MFIVSVYHFTYTLDYLDVSLSLGYFKIYKTVILPLVLYGCEIWSLTLKEEYRLSVIERNCFGEILNLRGVK